MTEAVTSSSFTISTVEHFDIRLEYNEDFAIVHLPRLDKPSKDVFIEARLYLEDLSKFLKVAGYQDLHIALDTGNTKMQRLAKMLEFEYLGEQENLYVYRYARKDH